MLHMKKVLILTILFLAGFGAGVITMEILSRPAQRVRAYRETLHAYKEILQKNFVGNQSDLGYKAFKEGNDLKAMVHLWTVLEAGPGGSELFKDPVSKAFDEDIDKALTERFFLETLPVINNGFKKVSNWGVPGREEATQNGALAVVLEQLGYKEAAREHYLDCITTSKYPGGPEGQDKSHGGQDTKIFSERYEEPQGSRMSHWEVHVISFLRTKETTTDNNALHLLLWSAEKWRQVSLVVILSFNP